jgi:D-inositol-3-phosphate glycosyltransferase
VPALEIGGGVPAVAGFMKNAVLHSRHYDLKLISLATSAWDDTSLGLSRPRSWRRGITTKRGHWQGIPFVHVGAAFVELEFQRYRPRRVLAEAVADCDILQVVCGSPAWANAVCGLGKPVAVQCATRARIERRRRDARPQGLAGWWRKALTPITDRMDARALRLVDAIQVENPWMLEYARRVNVGRDVDIQYAPPGIDTDTFCRSSRRSAANGEYILCVGRFADVRKNVGLLLDAYAQMPADVKQRVRLVLAGSSAPPESFWKRADSLALRQRITYVKQPTRVELVSLYQNASAFALPSDEEGLGVVLLEAMACGVPVVSTRSGGPEGIITDGEDGYLVAREDAASLADRLSRLCIDTALNARIGAAGLRTANDRYSLGIAGQRFLDVWDRLLRIPKEKQVVAVSSATEKNRVC